MNTDKLFEWLAKGWRDEMGEPMKDREEDDNEAVKVEED